MLGLGGEDSRADAFRPGGKPNHGRLFTKVEIATASAAAVEASLAAGILALDVACRPVHATEGSSSTAANATSSCSNVVGTGDLDPSQSSANICAIVSTTSQVVLVSPAVPSPVAVGPSPVVTFVASARGAAFCGHRSHRYYHRHRK